MRVLFLFLSVLFTSLSMTAQQSIVGIWNTGKDNTMVEIKSENGIYHGKLVSSDNVNAKKGTLLLKEVKWVNGKWRGKMYAPKKQEWFDTVIELKGDKLMLTVKSGMMSKTVEWTKA